MLMVAMTTISNNTISVIAELVKFFALCRTVVRIVCLSSPVIRASDIYLVTAITFVSIATLIIISIDKATRILACMAMSLMKGRWGPEYSVPSIAVMITRGT